MTRNLETRGTNVCQMDYAKIAEPIPQKVHPEYSTSIGETIAQILLGPVAQKFAPMQ